MSDEAMRGAFEAWMTEGGKWPRAVDRQRGGEYLLAQTSSAWRVWQAATLAASPEARALAQVGEFGGREFHPSVMP